MALIGKREFMHHTGQYLKAAESGNEIIITHNGVPRLKISRLQKHSIKELHGFAGSIDITGDINEPVLGDFFDDLT